MKTLGKKLSRVINLDAAGIGLLYGAGIFVAILMLRSAL